MTGSSGQTREFVISCAREPRDFTKEIRTYWYAVATPVVLELLAWAFFGEKAGPRTLYFWLAAVIALAALISALWSTSKISAERTLYLKTKGRELVLTAQELRCSIGLIERFSPTVARMRLQKQEYLNVSWKDILKFRVEKVIRGSPPDLLRLYTLNMGSLGTVSIVRSHFVMREVDVLREFRKRLNVPIEAADGPVRKDLSGMPIPEDRSKPDDWS